MASILYVETNYSIGYAKGQDSGSDQLAHPDRRTFRVAIPSICFMEALHVLNGETKARKKFLDELSSQLREAGRDETSASARSLVKLLEQAKDEAVNWLGDFRNRLTECLALLALHAELIPLNPSIAIACLEDPILDEPTDRLILHTILSHARSSDPGPKAFLSGNKNDFGQQAAIDALEAVGVRYFSRGDAAVGWLQAQYKA